jgi:hypothetical protein
MTNLPIPHPSIPNWNGELGWSAPGDTPSALVCFATDGDIGPTKISHNRDLISMDSRLEQDYNFIDYVFGSGEGAVTARHYLGDWDVKIDRPMSSAAAADAVAEAQKIDPAILGYFQKRFRSISIMIKQGYEALRSLEQAGAAATGVEREM